MPYNLLWLLILFEATNTESPNFVCDDAGERSAGLSIVENQCYMHNNKDLILENLRQGSHEAYFQVFSMYLHRLLHYAKRVVTAQEAEDIVMAAFIPFFDEHDGFGTWEEIEEFLYEEVRESTLFTLHVTGRTAKNLKLINKYFSDDGMRDERLNAQLIEHIKELSPAEREAFWKQMNSTGTQTSL